MPDIAPSQVATYAVIICFTPLSTLAVLLRFYSRMTIVKKFGLDDWFMLFANLGNIAYSCLQLKNLEAGTGKDFSMMDKPRWGYVLQIAYSTNIVATFTISCIQLSYIAFYSRFALAMARTYMYTIYALGVYIIMSGITFILANALRCKPISVAWNPYSYPKGCLNFPKLQANQAIAGIVGDLSILLLPIPIVVMLRVNNSRKVGLMVMFSLGLCVVGASLYRVHTLVDFDASNPTKSSSVVINTLTLEYNLGIIIACLPGIKPLYAKWFSPSKEQRPVREITLNTFHFRQSHPERATMSYGAEGDSAVAITSSESNRDREV